MADFDKKGTAEAEAQDSASFVQFDDDKSILYSGHSKNGRYDGIGVNKRKKYIQLIGKWEDDISNQHGKYLIC